MTDEQKKLVQDSWTKVEPISEAAAEMFYAKLFELDPSLRPMFKGDMKEQGKKLMTMIGFAVKSLNKLEDLVQAVKDMGARHVDYGVEKEHYDTVAAALLDTLAKGLGDDFTPEVKEAWTLTYVTLATVMQEGATEQAPA